jgi:CRP-like cAMP-binding protein
VRSASVVADTEMLVMAIARRGFLKLLESEPKIAISIMSTLAHRVRSMQATSSSV